MGTSVIILMVPRNHNNKTFSLTSCPTRYPVNTSAIVTAKRNKPVDCCFTGSRHAETDGHHCQEISFSKEKTGRYNWPSATETGSLAQRGEKTELNEGKRCAAKGRRRWMLLGSWSSLGSFSLMPRKLGIWSQGTFCSNFRCGSIWKPSECRWTTDTCWRVQQQPKLLTRRD